MKALQSDKPINVLPCPLSPLMKHAHSSSRKPLMRNCKGAEDISLPFLNALREVADRTSAGGWISGCSEMLHFTITAFLLHSQRCGADTCCCQPPISVIVLFRLTPQRRGWKTVRGLD